MNAMEPNFERPYCQDTGADPSCQSWLVVYGEVQEDGTLDYLRNAVGFVQAAVETRAVFPRPAKLHIATGGICTVYPKLAGDLEDPDYNNEHYSLRWEDCEFEAE